jgi:hypothetical protein
MKGMVDMIQASIQEVVFQSKEDFGVGMVIVVGENPEVMFASTGACDRDRGHAWIGVLLDRDYSEMTVEGMFHSDPIEQVGVTVEVAGNVALEALLSFQRRLVEGDFEMLFVVVHMLVRKQLANFRVLVQSFVSADRV